MATSTLSTALSAGVIANTWVAGDENILFITTVLTGDNDVGNINDGLLFEVKRAHKLEEIPLLWLHLSDIAFHYAKQMDKHC